MLDPDVVQMLRIPHPVIDALAAQEQRERACRGDRPDPDIRGRTVILVDDGLATGSTMRAAVQALRSQHPERLVVAVPVAAPGTCDTFRDEVDDVVCAITPEPLFAVGLWYRDFSQTTDREVHELLERATHAEAVSSAG